MPSPRLVVVPLGLACCSVEVAAALSGDDLPWRVVDLPGEPGAGDVHVLVVGGTVSESALPDVVAAWQRLPEPRRVVSFGACATSGGPYWDSYAVANGVDQVLPVDRYVPGCPPRPDALIDALSGLEAELAAGRSGSTGWVR